MLYQPFAYTKDYFYNLLIISSAGFKVEPG